MQGPRSPAAQRALGLYAEAPMGARVRTAVRWWTAPFAALELEVPLAGPVLDLGCGDGLFAAYLAVAGRARQVVGTDIDRDKVAVARQAARRLRPGEAELHFEAGDGRVPRLDGGWRSIVVADVLHLLGDDARRALLDDCVEALAPGGLLVIKEVDTRPRWKARLAAVQEVAATRLSRTTDGTGVDSAEPRALAAHLEGQGCTTMVKRLDHGYPHPHCLILATAPT
ncbi:class I SAM-dependent methyltransferase [Rhabdothermincola salaria]|uniref:class I SAM-dependent methyltransferase n=1 Tax=Rhabdothermincola salaria TaxID=2903142 RepID=UPI001E34D728|nr:class I SAM-dependent methyltransferase [Rhabdothermincola salaria]MCD9625368.1 class I SAM-dependent methyltransferase [Rhabdothermincola salaria]